MNAGMKIGMKIGMKVAMKVGMMVEIWEANERIFTNNPKQMNLQHDNRPQMRLKRGIN